MHSMKNIDGKECNTAKGANIATEFNEFKDSFKKVLTHKMKRIQGKKHNIGTCKINKISFSCFNDKRLVLDDGIHTLAYFHKDLKKKKRFLQMIIKNKRFSQIRIQKDSHKERDSDR